METHLLEIKKDLMRINFFKILFDLNEDDIAKIVKKTKKEIKENV